MGSFMKKRKKKSHLCRVIVADATTLFFYLFDSTTPSLKGVHIAEYWERECGYQTRDV